MASRDEPQRASGAPPRVITDSLAKPLARRFYKDASISDGPPFKILLDGRAIKTPKKRALEVPTRALAEAIAEEWRAQDTMIDPRRMPLTRFANTAIDAVSDALDAVAADIVAYAGSDLLCYRAEAPEELARLQSQHWDPIVAWAEEALGARLKVVSGVMHVKQPEAALAAVAAALEPHEAFPPDRPPCADDADGLGAAGTCAGTRRPAQRRLRRGRPRTSMRITRFRFGARTPKPPPVAGGAAPSSTRQTDS